MPLAQTPLQTAAAKKKGMPRLRLLQGGNGAGVARYSTTLQLPFSVLITASRMFFCRMEFAVVAHMTAL